MERANLQGKAQIVVGDTTSHGGKVISGSPSSTWSAAEIPIARKGDRVTCPLCAPHPFEIAEGLDGCDDLGQPMAVEGSQNDLQRDPHCATCAAQQLTSRQQGTSSGSQSSGKRADEPATEYVRGCAV